jgi:hypothetical protein
MLKFRKKSKIEFFDSIEEVPHRRYMKFNKELMRSNEVGSSPVDILKRIQRCIDYIMAGNNESALKELANAQLAYNYAMLELDPKGLALAAMVKSIDGEPCNDISSSGLQDTFKKLQDAGITKGELIDHADKIKKKSKQNSESSFQVNSMEETLSTIRQLLTDLNPD